MRRFACAVALLVVACQSRPGVDADDLTYAVRQGDVAKVKALLARGEDPQQPAGVNGWPPLIHAVHKNQLGTAEVLLEHGADVNGAAPDGMTPLMMAAGYGNDDMVQLLLRHGANPQLKSRDGSTALDFALTGTSDIDKFTLFQCQNSTVRLLARSQSKASSRSWARFKRCSPAS